MDSFTIDFGQLTQETMVLSSLDDFDSQEDNQVDEIVYPHSTGILYRIEKGRATFSVRGIPVLNISKAMDSLVGEDALFWDKLRIKNTDDLCEVQFFETDSFENSEVIKEEMIGRRFPYHEDLICNLTDPGFSWWGDFSKNIFHIYFKSHSVDRTDRLIRIGPIGDRLIIGQRFQSLMVRLEQKLELSEFSATDKQLSVGVDEEHQLYTDLKNIFLLGEFSFQLGEFFKNDKTTFFFLQELAVLRSFWLALERRVEDEALKSKNFYS